MILRLAEVRAKKDEGAALLITLAMLALLTVLTLTLAVITTNNLSSARAVNQAGSALNASDAGIAQAVTYLKSKGPNEINACATVGYVATSGVCTTQWGQKDNPMKVNINNRPDESYLVWIEAKVPYPAPNKQPGLYVAHAKGVAGGGSGRVATEEIVLDRLSLPVGIFSEFVNGGGNGQVNYQSIFTTGCVYKRSQIKFQGMDLQYGVPAAVHSTQTITESQGSAQNCTPDNKSIHTAASPCAVGGGAGSYTDYRWDTDANGGNLTGTPCYKATYKDPLTGQVSGPFTGAQGLNGQDFLTNNDESGAGSLNTRFGFNQSNLTQAQIDTLKTVAISQGNYYTTTSYTAPTQDDAVLFFDLGTTGASGRTVDLNNLSPQWSRPIFTDGDGSTNANCPDKSLIVIIQDGDAKMNSNSIVFGSLFMVGDPSYGNVNKANGNSNWIGTISARNIDLTGTANLRLDKCFLAHYTPSLYITNLQNYREVDRIDALSGP